MKIVSMGGLACDALGRQARYQEPGLLLSGKLVDIEHTIGTKGECRTKVRFDGTGNFLSITRDSSTDIQLEDEETA